MTRSGSAPARQQTAWLSAIVLLAATFSPAAGFSAGLGLAGRCVVADFALQGGRRRLASTSTLPVATRNPGRPGRAEAGRVGSLGVRCQVGSLYADQEVLIVKRGEAEEEMMKGPSSPILANIAKIKGSGAAGGFGGKKTKKAINDGLAAEGKSHAAVLRKQGVVRIDNVLTPEVADGMRDYALSLRQSSLEEVADGKIGQLYRFADVLLRTNRCDLTMPLGPDIVHNALSDVILSSPVSHTIKALLGNSAPLQELSCLISDPGSQRQIVHPDTPYGAQGGLGADEPVLFTCFIALQDILIDMGPTTWLPGTNTKDAHDKFGDKNGPKDDLLTNAQTVLGLLPKGCCAIFDSRTLHCGGANRSDKSRALFYFTFKNPKIGDPGNPPSIRPELINKLTLGTLRAALEEREKGGDSVLLSELAASLH